MDRSYWVEPGQFVPGENVVSQQGGVRLYDGEERTSFESGNLQLTTHRLIWDDEDQEGRVLAFDLSLVIKLESVAASFTKSAKTVVYLQPAPSSKPQGPSVLQRADYIKLSFRKKGQEEFHRMFLQQLVEKAWEKSLHPSQKVDGGLKMRAGIMEIERGIHKKQKEAGHQVSQAFKDLDALIDKAKDMVDMVNKFAAKIEEKKGAVSEDETIAFKAYLLSVGISNPVTRDTHGTGSNYHNELSKQLAAFLEKPLQEAGGMMTVTDVYCRFNRARGMELVSPEDVLNACRAFEYLQLPMRLRQFDSGVLVVQSLSHSEQYIIEDTAKWIKEKTSLSAQELSRLAEVSIMLSSERLLITEKAGVICRDDSVEGLRFYLNRFLSE